MTRVALDSNILLYAELEPGSDKGKRAIDIITRAHHDGVIPIQSLCEFLRVVQRRRPDAFNTAIGQAKLYQAAFLTPATTDEIMAAGADLAQAHGFQLWDAVICAASEHSGAKVLLSEDLQDGRVVFGMRILNPFASTNAAMVDRVLP